MAAILDVNGLVVRYRTSAGFVDAVRGVAFRVGEGEFVALVGGSGSGKSSAAWAAARLTDLLPCEVRGSVFFDGADVFRMDAAAVRALRRHGVGYVFQDPATALNPVMRVGAQITEALPAGEKGRVEELLRSVRIEDAERVAGAYPHELSGGMKQRAVIAMALAKKPRLIVADEPTSALDAVSQLQVLSLFLALKREKGLSALFITHDLNVARAICDRILVMHEGRIVDEIRDPRSAHPKHPYAVKLMRAAETGRHPKTELAV